MSQTLELVFCAMSTLSPVLDKVEFVFSVETENQGLSQKPSRSA